MIFFLCLFHFTVCLLQTFTPFPFLSGLFLDYFVVFFPLPPFAILRPVRWSFWPLSYCRSLHYFVPPSLPPQCPPPAIESSAVTANDYAGRYRAGALACTNVPTIRRARRTQWGWLQLLGFWFFICLPLFRLFSRVVNLFEEKDPPPPQSAGTAVLES